MTSTFADVDTGRRTHRARTLGVVLLLVVVVVGAVGGFGVHARTVVQERAGWTLTVTYPQVARAGLDVPWRLTVRHPGGLPDSLTVEVPAAYLDLFEQQGTYPDPDSATNDGHRMAWTFTTPPGDTFALDLDVYVQPGAQRGRTAEVVVIAGGVGVVAADIRTWLLP